MAIPFEFVRGQNEKYYRPHHLSLFCTLGQRTIGGIIIEHYIENGIRRLKLHCKILANQITELGHMIYLYRQAEFRSTSDWINTSWIVSQSERSLHYR